jgi:hypothetical protein
VRLIKTVKVKTGAGGIAANKGSTSIRFNYFDTSFMFLNCHLASGQKEHAERFSNLELCYSETVSAFHNSDIEKRPRAFDNLILMGDMNWRVDLPYHEAVNLANQNKVEDLKAGD